MTVHAAANVTRDEMVEPGEKRVVTGETTTTNVISEENGNHGEDNVGFQLVVSRGTFRSARGRGPPLH